MSRGKHSRRRGTPRPYLSPRITHPDSDKPAPRTTKEITVSEAAPVLMQYANWLSQPLKNSYEVKILELVSPEDQTVSIKDMRETLDISDTPIVKTLFQHGWMRIDDGRTLADGTWRRGTPSELEKREVLEPSRMTRAKGAVLSRKSVKTFSTTEETEETIVAHEAEQPEDNSIELDIVGRESMTIDELQDAARMLGFRIEIRAYRL